MSGAFPISSGPALNQAQQASKAAQGSSSSQTSLGSETSQTQQASPASAHTGTASGKNDSKDKDKDFPSLFKSMMQGDAADSAPAGVPMTAVVDATKLTATKADAKSATTDNGNQDGAAALAGLPVFAADTGKALPQLAWSGYVGVANNGGATALAMQGDQDNVISSQAVSGKDLPNVILKAQEQVANAQLQQGTTPASNGTEFTALMNKESLPALHMQHQFLADTAPQTLNASTLTNTHNTVVNDLSALVGTTAVRGGDNTPQQISVPMQQPQWSQQLGDRVQWMIGQNLHQADIQLSPPELGALKVHIQMHGDQASVNFSSPHAQVRDALDAATPRLREMMHEAGLTLGDVNVSGQALAQHQSRDPNPQHGQGGHVSGRGATDEPQAIISTSPIQRLSANGMLDVYA
jgi:flagellar hook-length control protein FliK